MIISAANRLNIVKEYYFSVKLKEISKLRSEGRNILSLGIGSPDLAPSSKTIEALVKTAQQKTTHGYQGYVGRPELRNAMSEWYANIYGVELDANNEILPLMGSKEGIMHISMAFLNAQDGVLVPNPGYPTYSSVSNLLSAKIHSYELDETQDWQPNWEQLERLDFSNIKIMWINYPNMPTGANASDELFERLIFLAKKHQFLLVNDNPYSLILNDTPRSIFQYKGAKSVALELNSLSKSHNMAGWRVGMLAGHKDYLKTVLKVKSNMDSGMFAGIQMAAVEALKNTKAWHAEQNAIYRKRREIAFQIMDALDCTYSTKQVGMFVLAKVPESVQDVAVWMDKLLYEAEIFITPAFIFGTKGERYIRLSLCSKQEVLKEALQRIKVFVGEKVS